MAKTVHKFLVLKGQSSLSWCKYPERCHPLERGTWHEKYKLFCAKTSVKKQKKILKTLLKKSRVFLNEWRSKGCFERRMKG